jgi:Phage integrase family
VKSNLQGNEAGVPITISVQHKTHSASRTTHFAALQKFHTGLGHGQLPRGTAFKETSKGLINFFGQVDRIEPKHALTLDNLRGILAQLDLTKFEDAVFWAALTTAFFGLLRISEYADGALKLKDVRVVPEGVILTIPFSKTSLLPVEVRLSARFDDLCPKRAVKHYLNLLGQLSSREAKSAFFARGPESKSGASMTKRQFTDKLKAHVKKLGLNPDNYAGHSCRRGGCTAMFLAGVSETFIAAHGRWRSLEYRKYLDFVNDTQWRPTLLLAERSRAGLMMSAAHAAQLIQLPGTRPSVGRR